MVHLYILRYILVGLTYYNNDIWLTYGYTNIQTCIRIGTI